LRLAIVFWPLVIKQLGFIYDGVFDFKVKSGGGVLFRTGEINLVGINNVAIFVALMNYKHLSRGKLFKRNKSF